jgi:hypothetical protein
LTYAARPPGGGAPQEAISSPPATAFRGEMEAQSRQVTHLERRRSRTGFLLHGPRPIGPGL